MNLYGNRSRTTRARPRRLIMHKARHGAATLTDADSDTPAVARVGVATDTDGMPVWLLSGRIDSMCREGRAALKRRDTSLSGVGILRGIRRRNFISTLRISRRGGWKYRARRLSPASAAPARSNAPISRPSVAIGPGWHAMKAGAVEHVNEGQGEAPRHHVRPAHRMHRTTQNCYLHFHSNLYTHSRLADPWNRLCSNPFGLLVLLVGRSDFPIAADVHVVLGQLTFVPEIPANGQHRIKTRKRPRR